MVRGWVELALPPSPAPPHSEMTRDVLEEIPTPAGGGETRALWRPVGVVGGGGLEGSRGVDLHAVSAEWGCAAKRVGRWGALFYINDRASFAERVE